MRTAAIALGSNLGDRATTLRAAATRLADLGHVRALSLLYETAPIGPPQPAYLNAIALVESTRTPREILDALLAIERSLGRIRAERWGPRTIDLDLISCGSDILDEPGLTLPHPEAHRRAFVLLPLAEIAPDLVLPGHGRIRDLVDALPPADRAGVRATDLVWDPA